MAEPRSKISSNVPLSLKTEIEKAAEVAGQTMSVWIARACRNALATPTRANASGSATTGETK